MHYAIYWPGTKSWHLVTVGFVLGEPWWCEESGKAVCKFGAEETIVDLRQFRVRR